MASATTFFARDGRFTGAGIGLDSGAAVKGNSGVAEAADLRTTFFAAPFFTATFLAVAFFAGGASSAEAGCAATFFAALLRAGGESPAVAAGV